MEDKLENSIMGKIKAGQVKLRSKYVFLAEKLGLGTAFALSAVLAVLFFNLILFYLKETDNLKYLSFGRFGIFAFLESFPYLLVITFVLLIVLSGYLITKSDALYKKPFGYVATGLIVLIMIFGGILTYTNIARKIEMEAYNKGHPLGMIFGPFMKDGPDVRNLGIAGMIFEKNNNYLITETPSGLRKVDLQDINKEDMPPLVKGQFFIAVGSNNGGDFVAQKIKVVDKNDLPGIGRGIDYKFGPVLNKDLDENNVRSLPMDFMQFKQEDKVCVKNCFDSGIPSKECFDKCIPNN